MIKMLKEEDRESVLNYLYQEPNFNIFPIGDIETFGFDKDFQKVYAEIDENGNYKNVLLFYRKNAIFYSDKYIFNEEYLNLIKENDIKFISGKSEILDLVKPYIEKEFKLQRTYFCRAKNLKIEESVNLEIKEISTEEEFGQLYDLLITIDEFGMEKRETNETFIQNKMKSKEMGPTLYIEEDGKIVSTVAATAETTKSAMVVGVATDKNYRKKGYASILMIELMKRYFKKNKELCLFYDNPEAGKIYLRLGFEYIGMYDLYKKE